MPKPYKRSSEILLDVARDKSSGDELTYGDILKKLGSRAFGLVFLFFALPSALPFSIIPGISLLFSLPILAVALQLIFARKTLWLPKTILERTISQEKIAKMIYTALPYLTKIERLSKPRLAFMTSRSMEIFNALAVFCLALLLSLPIPFSNFILAALIIIFSFGFIERDGLFMIVGYVGLFIYVLLVYMVILKAILWFLGWKSGL